MDAGGRPALSLTGDQRGRALERADAFRNTMEELVRRIDDGSITPTEVFEWADRDDTAGRIKVPRLLGALAGVSEQRSAELFDELGLHEHSRLSGLDDQQREILAGELHRIGRRLTDSD